MKVKTFRHISNHESCTSFPNDLQLSQYLLNPFKVSLYATANQAPLNVHQSSATTPEHNEKAARREREK